MPTGHEGEATIGVRFNRIEFTRSALPRQLVGEIVTNLTSDLISQFARSDRFVPSIGALREGLEVTVQIRDFEIESSGRRPTAQWQISAEGVKISGGRVAQMREKTKYTLDIGDEVRQCVHRLGDHAQPFFIKFIRECEKRY